MLQLAQDVDLSDGRQREPIGRDHFDLLQSDDLVRAVSEERNMQAVEQMAPLGRAASAATQC